MKLNFGTFVAAAIAASISSVDAVKILMAGDSTMAYTSTANMQGWGYPFANYVSLQVVNLARGGRSARTYTTEGLFAALVAQVTPGDFVIIEFGHNDGGSPATSTRAPTFGDGTETTTITNADGTVEVIQTFVTYLKWAIRDVIAKGGIPVVSSTTPNGDAWNAAHTEMSPPNRFVPYAKMAAGNYTSQGATYIDHYEYVTRHFEALGYANVYPALFPNDHTHTNAAGADHVARAFISGIACENHAMAKYLTAAGKALTKFCGTTTNPGTGTGTVAKYGQCGGIGYTGSTTCASGSTCTYANAYYSQCL